MLTALSQARKSDANSYFPYKKMDFHKVHCGTLVRLSPAHTHSYIAS